MQQKFSLRAEFNSRMLAVGEADFFLLFVHTATFCLPTSHRPISKAGLWAAPPCLLPPALKAWQVYV